MISARHLVISFLVFLFFMFKIAAQKPEPPIPIEAFFGNEALYFQLVVKKKFTPTSRFNFFTVATYTVDYENNLEENSIVMPVQISYDLGKGFGVMAGTDINSVSGFSAIVGLQFNYASKDCLNVNVASIFLNEDSDFNPGETTFKEIQSICLGWIFFDLNTIFNKVLKDYSKLYKSQLDNFLGIKRSIIRYPLIF